MPTSRSSMRPTWRKWKSIPRRARWMCWTSCPATTVGKAINRNSVLGQFYGGVAMGLGYGLLEEFDYEDSVPKQVNFDEYLIATSMDVPPIKAIIVENEDAAGPFGASP